MTADEKTKMLAVLQLMAKEAEAGRALATKLRAYYDAQRLDQRDWLFWLDKALNEYALNCGVAPETPDEPAHD